MSIKWLLIINGVVLLDLFVVIVLLNGFIYSLYKPVTQLVNSCTEVYYRNQLKFLDELGKKPENQSSHKFVH